MEEEKAESKPWRSPLLLRKTLDQVHGNWTQAARIMGCDERTIRRHAKKIEYSPPPVRQSPPRYLYIDIETAPNVADVWSLWNDFISLEQLRESSRMICFAARWRGKKKVEFRSEFHDSRQEMLEYAHKLISEADVLVHYNGMKFDVPALNREFLLGGLQPPAPSRQIDLYRVAKAKFHLPSYKMEYVARMLGLAGKIKHEGHRLWVNCLAGDKKAWATMRRYNIRDVNLLDEIYEKLLPWITNHPHVGLYTGDAACCPNCGSSDLKEEGTTKTAAGVYRQYCCQDCGLWVRDTKRLAGVAVQSVK